MTVYNVPLADIQFVLDKFCDLNAVGALPKFADHDMSVVPDMLAEAARFFEEKFALRGFRTKRWREGREQHVESCLKNLNQNGNCLTSCRKKKNN